MKEKDYYNYGITTAEREDGKKKRLVTWWSPMSCLL